MRATLRLCVKERKLTHKQEFKTVNKIKNPNESKPEFYASIKTIIFIYFCSG